MALVKYVDREHLDIGAQVCVGGVQVNIMDGDTIEQTVITMQEALNLARQLLAAIDSSKLRGA